MFVAIAGVAADGPDAASLAGGETNFYVDDVVVDLAPSGDFTDMIVDELTDLDPRVGIEIAIPIAVSDRAFTEDGILTVYNILRSVSTMEGIEYYSASRGRMRTFYHESYAIAGPDDEARIPDPVVDTIPRVDTIYVRQRDGSFGTNVQEITYRAADSTFFLSMVNTTTMVYKVVPLVTPGNLQTFLVITPRPEDGTIEFYGNLGVRVPALFGMRERARDSFYNRIVALHDWFSRELAAAGLK